MSEAATTTAGAAPPGEVSGPPAPVRIGERLVALDVVRGFALLGILLMNAEFFLRPVQALYLGRDETAVGLDRAAGWLVAAFVQGKFYVLFSLLFGMGFAIQFDRWRRSSGRFAGRFVRRMVGLIALGAAHAFLIWYGDILLTYGVVGLLLLAFQRTPVRRLPKWGLTLILVPLLAGSVLRVWSGTAMASGQMPADAVASHEAFVAELRDGAVRAESVYATGTAAEIQQQRTADARMQLSFLPFFFPIVLGIFLLGAWFVRSGVVVEPEAHLPFLRRAAGIGLGAGAVLAVAAMLGGADGGQMETAPAVVWSQVLMQVAALLLAVGYLCGLVLLARRPHWTERLRPLAAAGRMALTNYLLQSVIFTAIAYSWGLGLYGRIPRATQLVVAVSVWGLNLLLSSWWLNRFRFGPAEWLWRSITYGRLQPLR